MLSRLSWLISGMVLGAVLTLGAQRYHVVHTKDGLTLVPKRNATLSDAYVDVRTWGVADWSKHPDLLWSLHSNNRTDILGGTQVFDTDLNNLSRLFDRQQ